MATSHIEKLRESATRYQTEVRDMTAGFSDNKVVREAFDRVVQDLLRLEDQGWSLINKLNYENQKGLSLADAKNLTGYIEENTKKLGSLLGRGLRLKNNHAFGRGFTFETLTGNKIRPRFDDIIHDEDNWTSLFSPTALKELNRILFTSGNLFVMFDSRKRLFTRLGIDTQIENAITYPDDKSKIKYILRQYEEYDEVNGGEPKKVQEYVPTYAYKERMRSEKGGLKNMPKTLANPVKDKPRIKVNQDAVIIEKRVNKDNGDTWGVPDGFSAAPWAIMYSTYVKDGAKLQNALTAIAYVVKASTEAQAKSAGAQLANARVGGGAVVGPKTQIESMPRSGSVNLYEGRPIQAQAAAAMDVSVTGLAADPGLGGSYASENALSQPEQLAALSRQEDFVDFFRQVFRAMGARDENELRLNFKRLDIDPIHRTMQGLSLARLEGGINQQEYRDAVVELYNIVTTTTELPVPDEWTGSKVASLRDMIDKLADDPDADPDDDAAGAPSQGRSGSVGSFDDNGNDARASDRDASQA